MKTLSLPASRVIRISEAGSEPSLTLPDLPQGDSYRFHTMIKPGGSQCNLDCDYCYYLHKDKLLEQPKSPRMSESVLRTHIRQYIEAQTGDQVVFSWQGGEPTLMPLDFFRNVVRLQQEYRKPGQRIENDLQTNGTLLDDEWCGFLKEHGFLVGLSIDGPAGLHDAYRRNKGGEGTFEKVFVDQFENVISQMFGHGAQKCVSAPICGKGLALEHNGDVYSCDHFVYPEYKLGNIRQVHEGNMAFSKEQERFAFAKRDTLPQYCKRCSFLELCWGECPKNRFVKTPDGENGLNYLCPGLKKFYAEVTAARSELRRRLGM